MLSIADAVDYANEKGVIHRDLKPENIMIDPKGNIKIMDFGLAKFVEKDLTQSMGGTPPYMSPESWKGKIASTTDQWSLAVIGLEMLNGSNLFFADNLEEIREKIMKPIKSSDCFLFDAPRIVTESFLKALSPDPELRFASCKDFVKRTFRYWHYRSKSSKKTKIKGRPIILPNIKNETIKN